MSNEHNWNYLNLIDKQLKCCSKMKLKCCPLTNTSVLILKISLWVLNVIISLQILFFHNFLIRLNYLYCFIIKCLFALDYHMLQLKHYCELYCIIVYSNKTPTPPPSQPLCIRLEYRRVGGGRDKGCFAGHPLTRDNIKNDTPLCIIADSAVDVANYEQELVLFI